MVDSGGVTSSAARRSLERAYLDRVVLGQRMGGRELDGLLPAGAADDVEARDALPAREVRPVGEQRLAVADAQRRGRGRVLQRPAQDEQAARRQVLPPGLGR